MPLSFLKQAEHITKICCFVTAALIHAVIMDVLDKSILKECTNDWSKRRNSGQVSVVDSWRKK